MIKKVTALFTFALITLGILTACSDARLKALIVTGQNNHNWKASHLILAEILEKSDRFTTQMAISPAKGEDMSGFSPEFDRYDVVVLDYNGDEWSEAIKTAFEEYVKNGGGVVIYHASDNSFPKWEAFNKMIGVGGWGERDEKSGPYLYWRNDSIIRDDSPGRAGSHGKQHEFVVEHRVPNHPILKGLPMRWLHAMDELYAQLRGPAENMEVLATAWSDPKTGGTGRNEPALMTIQYGQGRVFHTTLGHVGKDRPIAAQSAGFIYTLQRGAEWAATGNVTQELPVDFSNVAAPLILPSYEGYSLDQLFELSKQFEYGKSQKHPYLISERIRRIQGDESQMEDFEKRIIALLKSDATDDSKNYFCRELSWMGSSTSVPVLNELLKNEGTRDMALLALERIGQQ